jgi:hypothetical protein
MVSFRKSKKNTMGGSTLTPGSLALVVLVPLALTAGTVLAPASGERCGSMPFVQRNLCVSLDYSGIVARGLAQRSRTAALRDDNALVYALTSSPMLGVDFGPLRSLSWWWMEETGKAIMARHRSL